MRREPEFLDEKDIKVNLDGNRLVFPTFNVICRELKPIRNRCSPKPIAARMAAGRSSSNKSSQLFERAENAARRRWALDRMRTNAARIAPQTCGNSVTDEACELCRLGRHSWENVPNCYR
jgi:hypothetical protein